jgi:beta-lactam-binding protein with PASTA domain
MTAKRFFSKLFSPYIWLNLLAMGIIVVLLCLGLKYGLDLYTHHGQTVEVPTIIHKSYNDAEDMLDKVHLNIVVSDTDYVKTLPPDCILEQSPLEGEIVKPGRIVYVKINAPHTPKRPLPDVIDNFSMRDAQSKLLALGFQLADPEYIPGEREWVYGIKCQGRQLASGDRVSIDNPLTLLIGNGMYGDDDDIDFTDGGEDAFPDDMEDYGDIGTDDFEEIPGPLDGKTTDGGVDDSGMGDF